MAKLSLKSAEGTSYHEKSIFTSVKRLREVVGDPQWEENTGENKTNFDWICETEAGHVFTIYDWKEYRPLSEEEVVEFYIRAHSSLVSILAVKELQELLSE